MAYFCKGHVPADELVQTHADRPQVDLEAVPLPEDNFWSHIVWRSNEGECSGVVFQELRGPKIDQPHVAFRVQHHIFRLQVSVNDIQIMQVFNTKNQRPNIKLTISTAQQPDFPDRVKQLHPLDILRDEVDVQVVLQALKKPHDQREVHNLHHPLLLHHVLLDVLLRHRRLRHALYRVQLLVKSVLRQIHRPELPLAKPGHVVHVLHLQVIQLLHRLPLSHVLHLMRVLVLLYHLD